MSFLINILAGLQLSPIFIKEEAPALRVVDSNLKFLTATFSTLLLWKKHCYKKRESDTYRKSNLPHFCISGRENGL